MFRRETVQLKVQGHTCWKSRSKQTKMESKHEPVPFLNWSTYVTINRDSDHKLRQTTTGWRVSSELWLCSPNLLNLSPSLWSPSHSCCWSPHSEGWLRLCLPVPEISKWITHSKIESFIFNSKNQRTGPSYNMKSKPKCLSSLSLLVILNVPLYFFQTGRHYPGPTAHWSSKVLGRQGNREDPRQRSLWILPPKRLQNEAVLLVPGGISQEASRREVFPNCSVKHLCVNWKTALPHPII